LEKGSGSKKKKGHGIRIAALTKVFASDAIISQSLLLNKNFLSYHLGVANLP
jgi:hypothetical protein